MYKRQRLVFVIRVVPCVTVIPLVFEIPSILNTRYWLFLAFQRYFCTPSIWPWRICLRDTCVLCVCVCAVSYTHLDVYKRQGLYTVHPKQRECFYLRLLLIKMCIRDSFIY